MWGKGEGRFFKTCPAGGNRTGISWEEKRGRWVRVGGAGEGEGRLMLHPVLIDRAHVC